MLRWLLVFVCLLAVLFGLEMLNSVQAALVNPWTALVARASADIVRLIDPTVISYGSQLKSASSGFAVAILPGCNGVEAAIVLIAAMVAFPSPLKYKFWGILIGFLAVQFINLLRVVTLFFIGQWNFTVFEFAHRYMWPSLIMLDVLIVWLLWLRFVASSKKGRA